MFGRVVADAIETWHKHHSGRAHTGKHLGIVSRSGRHSAHAMAQALGVCFHEVNNSLVKRDRFKASEHLATDGHSFVSGELHQELGQPRFGFLEESLVGVAQIDREHRSPRHHVDQIGMQVDLADGCHLVTAKLAGDLTNEHRHGGGSVPRVMPI